MFLCFIVGILILIGVIVMDFFIVIFESANALVSSSANLVCIALTNDSLLKVIVYGKKRKPSK